MLLYRTHPTSSTTNSIINLSKKEELVTKLCEGINHRDSKEADIVSLVTDASIVDAMVSSGDYINVLVLPSPITQERLRNTMYQAIGNAGDMLFPIIHNLTGGKSRLYVGLPEEGHLYKELWEDYGVETIPMENWFTLDRKIQIGTNTKFDAIVLLGCDHSSKTGTFKSEDIKSKLSKVMHSESVLIDVNRRNSKRKISGECVDVTNQKNNLLNSINTPEELLDTIGGFSLKLYSDIVSGGMKFKTSLHYAQLMENVLGLEKYYKVYK